MIRAVILAFTMAALGAAALPDCTVGSGWQQHGETRKYDGDTLYEYMNGNSEGYFLYGFVRMTSVTCKKDGDTIHVDVSEMASPEYAYGMFTANRDRNRPVENIGTIAQVSPRRIVIAKGKYYLEIAAESDKDHSAELRKLGIALADRVEGATGIPAQIGWFAKEGLVTGTPRLVPQSVLGIGLLKSGYVAEYADKSRAFVVTEADLASAQKVFIKLQARFGESAPASIPGTEEAFTTKDKYLGRVVVFRQGTRIGGYVGASDTKAPADVVAPLLAALGS